MGTSMTKKTHDPDLTNDQLSMVCKLPDDILLEIFVRVPPKSLMINCSLVCRMWYSLIASRSLWLAIFKIRFLKPLHDSVISLNHLQKICCMSALGKNLIKNGNAEDLYNHWKIEANGGHKFVVEEEGVGSQKLSELHLEDIRKCWATSYGWCSKIQTIDLHSEGFSSSFIDKIQPKIVASEWTAGRWDCGSKYILTIKLLDEKKNVIAEKKNEKITADWYEKEWSQVQLAFENYGPVRYIEFEHAGKDTKYWAGTFGAKFTGASVILSI